MCSYLTVGLRIEYQERTRARNIEHWILNLGCVCLEVSTSDGSCLRHGIGAILLTSVLVIVASHIVVETCQLPLGFS